MTKLFAALLPALLIAAAPAPLSAADDAAIRRYVTRVLTAYREHAEPTDWKAAFTPDTQALGRRNERLNHGEESEALGADPICGCQDWRTIRVTGIALAPRPDGRVVATVRIVNFGPATRTFVLARTPAGWRLWDVLESGRYSLRTALQRDSARLERQGRH